MWDIQNSPLLRVWFQQWLPKGHTVWTGRVREILVTGGVQYHLLGKWTNSCILVLLLLIYISWQRHCLSYFHKPGLFLCNSRSGTSGVHYHFQHSLTSGWEIIQPHLLFSKLSVSVFTSRSFEDVLWLAEADQLAERQSYDPNQRADQHVHTSLSAVDLGKSKSSLCSI